MTKQVKYRGRLFPLKREDGAYVIIESYGLERRVLKDEVIYEEPETPKDVLKPVLPDKLEETLPPANDIVTPKPEGDEFHGKTVKNIRDGRVGKVASIGTLRHTPNSQSVTVYWETDPKNPQEIDKRLLEIIPEQTESVISVPGLSQTPETLAKDDADRAATAAAYPERKPLLPGKDEKDRAATAKAYPPINEAMPNPEFNKEILAQQTVETTPVDSNDMIGKFKEEMKKVWENSFTNPRKISAGRWTVDVEYPDSESPGETLTYRVVFDLYGEGLEMMEFVSVDDLTSPQDDTGDYDQDVLERLVDQKITAGEFHPASEPERQEDDDRVPQGDSDALDSDYLDETKQPDNTEDINKTEWVIKFMKASEEDKPMIVRAIQKIETDGEQSFKKFIEQIIWAYGASGVTFEEQIQPVKEATVAPAAGGTNQSQPNDGAFNARIGQKVVQPKPL